ncbi:Piso0_000859 [Millerozyma farinosa CBS 7064]|uniref:Lactoylglutathione lyase n=1 Tax=Pichia sorbitophila (strain ATCC MYA-4447 / BCRC 22081 / CBS 7064 / NBRC 10061 / NRRL Y-12695) TaxID=559304 RepID=G8YQ93_PICSO|nr:Piso0_000859 [Millerozyma farinosa CBS 7064]
MVTFDNSFIMNHTCLRIKDPKVSLPFYTENFGMEVVATLPFEQSGFTLYMLAFTNSEDVKGKAWNVRQGILELTHNHGAESEEPYNMGEPNGGKPRGFGHICFSVDNIEAAEAQFLQKGVQFKKKLSDGRQKNIAFALDPNGYWIELIEHGSGKQADKTSAATYRFNHSMIRVRDAKASVEFYRSVCGMKLLSTRVHENAKFTLYFLGYDHNPEFKENTLEPQDQAHREGIIELTHNWGTENDSSFWGYHNGNSTENGAVQDFGHTCISCDNPAKFCSEIDAQQGDKADWALKWNQGKMKGIAFLRDPDGYSIEIIGSSFKT